MNEWQIRAKKYNSIQWVTDNTLLNQLLKFCNLKPADKVLEVGCGTGVISQALISKVNKVVAQDYSKDMLDQFTNNKAIRILCSLEQLDCFKDCFDKIIGRMVFHHVKDLKKAFSNCYQMLKSGGCLIIQEGIPPSEDKDVVKWTSDLRNLKEKRNHFTETSLKQLMLNAGFTKIETKIITNKQFSIINWIENSWKNTKFAYYIYGAHLAAPEKVKKAYKMHMKEKDIIIETKNLLIKGYK